MKLLSKYTKYIITTVFCVLVIIIILSSRNAFSLQPLRIYFLNVGQGDSVLFVSPNGNTLLYDSGPPGLKILSELDKILPTGNRHIDVAISSHPDADHIGGYLSLKSRYKIETYIDTAFFHPSSLFADTQEMLETLSALRYRVGHMSVVGLGSGLSFVLSNIQDEGVDANNGSIVLQAQYGKMRILCTGDMDTLMEERLVETYGESLQSTIFKAGHHGAKTSNSERILRAASPEFVVISSGKNNTYGHPHVSALGRMAHVGAKILETAKSGTIMFECSTEACIQKTP